MSLANFTPATDVVLFRGKPLTTVRGLSLDDIAILMRENLSDLDQLLKLYAETDDRIAVAATAQFAISVAKEMPQLVARTICLASDEPDAEDNARRLPIPTQIDALMKIIKLTFEDAGGAKKFFESLMQLVKTVAPTIDQQDSNT